MEYTDGPYAFIGRARQCYRLLQDELSRKIFRARLVLDFDQSSEAIAKIVKLGEQQSWLDAVEKKFPAIRHTLEHKPRKLVLYGTNLTGRTLADLLQKNNIEFYGFCGRGAARYPNGLLGKPVIPPDRLFQDPDAFCVIIAAGETADEIRGILREHHFPRDQILASVRPEGMADRQYFEFPSLFRRGTAFVDGGCLDCRTSGLFAEWCENQYSQIYAFEPDPVSYSICKENLAARNIRDFRLIRAGLSDREGESLFSSGFYGSSRIVDSGRAEGNGIVTVRVTTIDGTVGENEVGFIKMDIEGAEYRALCGAEKVILRDKPLLAISVYHRPGDMLVIMDYLRRLVPEYRFWLRHYSVGLTDTVLYAAKP